MTLPAPSGSRETPDVRRPGSSTPARPLALLSSQLLFNVGFFAVVPFLAGVLREDFALAGAAVGLTLGLRTAAQQGLFLVGGALADRLGGRLLILTGCAVRATGFLLLAWSTTSAASTGRLAVFVVGTVLTGVGGALFSPALEALVARAGARTGRGGRDLFALLAVFGETGAAVGPLLGALLLGWGFAAVAASGAALFTIIAVALAWVLPPDRTAPKARSPHRGGAFIVLRDRRFVALAALASVNLLAYNQLYLGLPVELDRVGAGAGSLALIFAWISVLTIMLQLPIARLSRRWGERSALRLGYLLLSASFATLTFAAPVSAPGYALAPALLTTTLLALGHMVLGPLVLSLVPRFAPEQRLASYFGLLATCGGIAVLLGNTLLGALYARAGTPGAAAALPWAVLTLVPLLPAWLVPRLVPTHAPGRTDSSD